MVTHQRYKAMEIRNMDGSITWQWDAEKSALVTLLPNGDRQQFCAGDTALLLKLLLQDKVRMGMKAEIETYDTDAKALLGDMNFL
jgi:hypothetical protein